MLLIYRFRRRAGRANRWQTKLTLPPGRQVRERYADEGDDQKLLMASDAGYGFVLRPALYDLRLPVTVPVKR